jgi:predicted amidophosphoribosyltransferase
MHDKPPLQVDIAGPSGGWSYKLTAIRTSLPNFAYIVTVGKSKATRKCPFCGKQVRVQANFCNRCGRQIKNIVHAHDFRYAQDL